MECPCSASNARGQWAADGKNERHQIARLNALFGKDPKPKPATDRERTEKTAPPAAVGETGGHGSTDGEMSRLRFMPWLCRIMESLERGGGRVSCFLCCLSCFLA